MKRRTNPEKALRNSSSSLKRTEFDSLDALIEARVTERLDAALSSIVVEQTTVRQSSYSGPLPPAEETRRYEEVYPGFTDRWIKMAEKAQVAEIAMIKRRDDGELLHKMASLTAAFLLCAGLIGGGIWLINCGKSTAGFGTLGTGVGAVLLAGVTRAYQTKPKAVPKPKAGSK